MAKINKYDYGDEFNREDRQALKAQGFAKDQINKYRNTQVKKKHMSGGQLQASGNINQSEGKEGLRDYSAYGVKGRGANVASQKEAGLKEGWTQQDINHLQKSGYTDNQIRKEMTSRTQDGGGEGVRMGKRARTFMEGEGNSNQEWATERTKGLKNRDYDHGDSWGAQDRRAMKAQGYTEKQMESYRKNRVATSELSGGEKYKTGRMQGKGPENISDYSAYGVSGQGVGARDDKRAGKKAGWTRNDIKYLQDEGFSNKEIRNEMKAREGDMRMGKKAKAFLNKEWRPNRGTKPGGNDPAPDDGSADPNTPTDGTAPYVDNPSYDDDSWDDKPDNIDTPYVDNPSYDDDAWDDKPADTTTTPYVEDTSYDDEAWDDKPVYHENDPDDWKIDGDSAGAAQPGAAKEGESIGDLNARHQEERDSWGNTTDRTWEEPELFQYDNPTLHSNQGITNSYGNQAENRWREQNSGDHTVGMGAAISGVAAGEALTGSKERMAGFYQHALDSAGYWGARSDRAAYENFGEGDGKWESTPWTNPYVGGKDDDDDDE